MSQSEIDLDQIQRRLGGRSGTLFGAGRDSVETDEFPVADISSERGDSTFSVGFAATALALFLGVGSGTYFFFDGGIGMPDVRSMLSSRGGGAYLSSVEPLCGKGWREGESNVSQMHCFLTTSISRLCEPEERQALVATVQKFEQDSLADSGDASESASSAVGDTGGNALPDHQLAFDVTALAVKGYITAHEFGPDQPGWVRKGFAEVRAVSPRCPQTG